MQVRRLLLALPGLYFEVSARLEKSRARMKKLEGVTDSMDSLPAEHHCQTRELCIHQLDHRKSVLLLHTRQIPKCQRFDLAHGWGPEVGRLDRCAHEQRAGAGVYEDGDEAS